MSVHLSHEKALRSSIRIRIFIGVGLIALLGLTASCALYWINRPEQPTALPSAATARAVATVAKPAASHTAPPAPSYSTPQTTTENASAECAECTLLGVTQRLADRLPPDFAQFRAALQDQSVREGNKGYAALNQLLAAAKAAPPEHRPDLLLAADVVASRLDLSPTYPPTPETRKQIDELADFGLTFRWAELGAMYDYDRDLIWQLWKDSPGTAAGEDAFLLLLDHGWDTSSCCAKNSDGFRNVIREAEQFLAARPNSARRLQVEFLAAQAYETWWSLSRPPEVKGIEEITPEAYQQGADAAREKAIAYYDDIRGKAPDGPEAKCAVASLALLREKRSTNQFRFFCYCD
jgi:hypothetical protein